MADFLGGAMVLLACMSTIYCYSQLIFVRHISIDDKDKKEEERLRRYKIKMKYIYSIGFISFFVIGILGYLFNCKFILFQDRVAGVQQFIVFFIIFMMLKYIESRKEKYKIKKHRISIKNDSKIVIIIMCICFIGTIISNLL